MLYILVNGRHEKAQVGQLVRMDQLVLAPISDTYGSGLDCGVRYSVRHTSRDSHS